MTTIPPKDIDFNKKVTVLIVTDDELSITFYVVQGDLTRFQGILANLVYDDKESTDLSDQLVEEIYNEDGSHKHPPVTVHEADMAIKNGAALVVVGYCL